MAEARPLSHLLLLAAIVVMWGSSPVLTKIAVAVWPPHWIVAGRLLLGAATLVLYVQLRGHRWPRRLGSWGFFLVSGLLGNSLPFWLITWGQSWIPAGATAVLLGITPLATLLLARRFVADERFDARRLAGFVLGFLGILVLVGPDAVAELVGGATPLLAELAVLAGGLCYAATTVIARLRPGEVQEPVVAAAGTLVLGALLSTAAATPLEVPPPAAGPTLWAVLVLGLFGTALPTVCFFLLVSRAGPAFTSTINYFIPIWGVGLAALSLGEPLEPQLLLALALVLTGMWVAERRTQG